MAQTRHLLS